MTTETALSAQPCQPYVHPYGHEHSLQLDLMQDLSVTLEAIGVHWRRVETAWTYPRHSHAQFELKMVTQGTLGMELAGETFRLQAGDMILVPPYQIHRAWAEGVQSTEQILHPEKWLAKEAPLVVPAPDAQSFGAGFSELDTDTFGELGLRLTFGEWIDESRAESIARMKAEFGIAQHALEALL